MPTRFVKTPGLFALACAFIPAITAGCATPMPPQIRVDPAGYVYHGYLIESADNVDFIIEEIRYMPESKGTIAVDIAILSRRPGPIKVDYGSMQLRINNRSLLPQQPRAVTVSPNKLDRATLSFRTDLTSDQLVPGAIRFSGVTLDTGERLKPFVAGFHKASHAELRKELGALSDEVAD